MVLQTAASTAAKLAGQKAVQMVVQMEARMVDQMAGCWVVSKAGLMAAPLAETKAVSKV
jgi:xanthine dehydrogenase molybdopterin-binding subunit B